MRQQKNTVFPTLETEDGRKSDHSIVMASYALTKRKQVEWIRYMAREKTDVGKKLFQECLVSEAWETVLVEADPNRAVKELNKILGGLMDDCFPKKSYLSLIHI